MGKREGTKQTPKLNSLGWVGAGEGGGEGGGVELGGLFCPFSFPHDKPVPEPPISMCVLVRSMWLLFTVQWQVKF